ncbi:hypothetical protein D9M71_510350 [compost metagenome]
MFSALVMAIDRPVSNACSTNSNGARNMKANSIGSVTPVRNAVNAIDRKIPPITLRRSGRALRYIARHAAGRPKIIIGNMPVMNWPPFGSPAK